MLMLATMIFAMVSNRFAQEPVPTAEQQGPPAASQAAPTEPQQTTTAQQPDQKQVITVPAGTKVVLSLANPIKPKAARRGDSVRAVTAFPVTVNEQVAIPEGVLVEGVVDKLVKKDRWGHPWVEVHFTRMVFPNGYVLPLEAESTEARADQTSGDEAEGVERAHENGPSAESAFEFQLPPQQPPTLPPMPKPNYGPVIGLGVAGAAVAVAVAVIAAHHRYDEFFYNVGWQFDMVLQGPVQVDAASWNADVGN